MTPNWESVPPSEGSQMEWHLRCGRIRAVVRLHQGTYYYGIAWAGRAEFGNRAFCATEETAKQRAEKLLEENIKPIIEFYNSQFTQGVVGHG